MTSLAADLCGLSGGPMVCLLEVALPAAPEPYTLQRLAINTEPVTWGGNVYEEFSAEVGYPEDDLAGRLPTVNIRLENVTRAIQRLVELYGTDGATITARVVAVDHPSAAPMWERKFSVGDATFGSEWADFQLEGANPYLHRCRTHQLQFACRYEQFKSPLCGYTGAATSCDRSLKRCAALGNSARFGGQPGLAGGAFRVV